MRNPPWSLRHPQIDIGYNFEYNFEKSSENEFASDLLRGLNQFRHEGTLCDLTLRAGESTMRVHKLVISVRSPYFKAMFSGNFSESDQQEISINEMDADSLHLLIDYMYTEELNVNSENVRSLLLAASFLQITKAEELCCDFILNELNDENCIEYLLFAGNNLIPTLVDSSIEFACENFSYIFFKNEYLQLEFEEFKKLVQGLKKEDSVEDLVYTFIMRWINYSNETRITFIAELLDNLDPLLISPNVLQSSRTLNTSTPILTALAEKNPAMSHTNESGEHILVSRRLGTFPALRIKIFSEAKHRQIFKLPANITDGSYVCHGYYIYHQGGWMHGVPLDDTYVYHPTSYEWLPFGKLQQARAYHRSCELNGRIYSVGGSDGFKALPSVEFIDLFSGQRWLTDPLPRAKERTGLGIHENAVYVVGGCNRGTPYKCVHRFDAREGMWQELAASPFRAGASSCAVIGESIYTTHPDTLQRYDIRANNWAMISAQYKRYPLEVFSLNNTLFGLFSDHIARFVHEEEKWINQRALKCNLPYLQVSTNLQYPIAKEEDVAELVFEGYVQSYNPPEEEMQMYGIYRSDEYEELPADDEEDDGCHVWNVHDCH